MSRVSPEVGAAFAGGVVLPASPGTSRHAIAVGLACVIGSALGFGAMAILARVAYRDGVDVPTLLALRFSIAAVGMLGIVVWRREPRPANVETRTLVLLGALGYAGQAYAFFTALTYAPAAIVSLLLYTYPALVAILAAWRLRETLTARKIAALALALGGVALTVGPALLRREGAVETQPIGIVLGVCAAAIYAVYIVAGSRVTRTVAATTMSAVVIASAAVVFVLVVLVHGVHLPASRGGWLAVLGIAVVSTILAINLFFAGLARVGPTRASTLSTIEPVFTIALAAVVLNEQIAPLQLAGGALILIAVVLLARAPAEAS